MKFKIIKKGKVGTTPIDKTKEKGKKIRKKKKKTKPTFLLDCFSCSIDCKLESGGDEGWATKGWANAIKFR